MIDLLATVCALTLATPSSWTTDAEGRTFRVGFDPGSRLMLGAGGAWDDRSHVRLESAIYLRGEDHDRGVNWKLSHTLLAGEATLGDTLQASASLYRGEYLRWSADGAITIPTSPPTRIAFPLDIGFAVEVGRISAHPERETWDADVGVVAAEILFDMWRSPTVGSYFVLGVGPRYDLWVDPDQPLVHVVSPFSSARLTLHHELTQGRHVLEATVGAGTAWTSRESGPRWSDEAHADVSWEWIFLAINDDPVSLRVWGRWRWDELVATHDGHVLQAGAGLRIGL